MVDRGPIISDVTVTYHYKSSISDQSDSVSVSESLVVDGREWGSKNVIIWVFTWDLKFLISMDLIWSGISE